MIPFVVCLLVLFPPASACADTLDIRVNISPDARAGLPSAEAVQSSVTSAFQQEYGRRVAETAGVQAAVTVTNRGSVFGILTELTRGSSRRTLSSTVPTDALGSLVPTIAGDCAFLWFSLASFAALPLGPPPSLSAVVQTDALQRLTGWSREELEPIGLAGSDAGIIVCFPHRWLTLGPSLELVRGTMQDLRIQASGPERLLLSGVTAGRNGDLFLLSERGGKIVRVNPRREMRQMIDAAGLTALGGAAVRDGVAALNGKQGAAALLLFTAHQSRSIALAAAYASAAAADQDGNLWVWDAEERRIRVISLSGTEVFSIKPLLPASFMELPQQLVVLRDGSFLLGGSGEVWKLDRAGIPAWRMTKTGARPGGPLPASFSLAPSRRDGSFVLLDLPSRRLLLYAETGSASPPDQAPSILTRLDPRKAADQEWDAALFKEEAGLFSAVADEASGDLRFADAERALARAVDLLRIALSRNPGDTGVEEGLHREEARLRDTHQKLVRGPELEVTAESPRLLSSFSWQDTIIIQISVKNPGPAAVSGVRVIIDMPGIGRSPAAAALGSISPGAVASTEIRLTVQDPRAVAPDDLAGSAAYALLSWQRSGASVESASRIPLPTNGPGPGRGLSSASPGRELAAALADAARPGDPLMRQVAAPYLPQGAERSDALAALAAVLDDLGALRAMAAASATAAPAVSPPFSARDALRTLGRDDSAWISLVLSLAGELRIPASVLVWPDSTLALVETDVPFEEALSREPALRPFELVLKKLSRDGRLCLPVSGGVLAGSPGPGWTGRAVAAGLQQFRTRGIDGAVLQWLDAAPAPDHAAAAGSGLPVLFPSVPSPPSRDTVRIEIREALSR